VTITTTSAAWLRNAGALSGIPRPAKFLEDALDMGAASIAEPESSSASLFVIAQPVFLTVLCVLTKKDF